MHFYFLSLFQKYVIQIDTWKIETDDSLIFRRD